MSSTVIRTITGPKEEFLLYLKERRDQALEETKNLTRMSQAHSRGYVDGIEFAMAAVADWQVAPMTDSEILRAARFMLSRYINVPEDEEQYAGTVRTAAAFISLASARAQQEELSNVTKDN